MSRTLYTYFRSSAAWRVRIALALKGLDYTAVPVHLVRDGGMQHAPEYKAMNPQALVPTLVEGDTVLTQSLAIIEYLDECYPEPPLLPGDARARARIRALALAIACDIHPLNNLRVLQYLKGPLGQGQDAVDAWYQHWITVGFGALEAQLTPGARYMVGDTVTLADVCLVPQLANARRFHVDLSPFPNLVRIDAALMALPAFADTQPARQPDAE